MAKSKPTRAEVLLKTISACHANGARILEETYDLEFREPSSSRFYLAMIAQEEFAKAFILLLVKEEIVRISPPVLRAINNHVCKQLVGMIMDYIIMHWDEIEDFEAALSKDFASGDRLPDDIGSAMEIFRYEKIDRWESNQWSWAEDPKYDRFALQIAEGKMDIRKQDALYVRVGPQGQICSTPDTIKDKETLEEVGRATRFGDLIASILGGSATSRRYDKVISAFKVLFSER